MTFRIETLGCKVNQYESQLIHEELCEVGFNENDNADIIIVNSCTVTGEADSKTLKLLRKIKKENPNSVLLLTGCFPQVSPEEAKKSVADFVVGGRDKAKIKETLLLYRDEKAVSSLLYSSFDKKDDIQHREVTSFNGHTRAFIKIQEGCNRYCSYCIIPTARGFVRYKPIDEVVKEVRGLVKNGYKEIVFVGINLAMYGKQDGLDLADAVIEASKVEGEFRIRLGSTEPDLMTDTILNKLKSCDKFCLQFHLPLQSGNDKTLKEMNRRYTTSQFKDRVLSIREIFGEDIAISTDIIAGFPGETEEDFNKTLEFFEEMQFADAHVFAYSKREGTVAAAREDQVDNGIKNERAKALSSVTKQNKLKYQQKHIGKTREVLIEKSKKGGHDSYYNYVSLADDQTAIHGDIVSVEIKGLNDKGLVGVLKNF